jgi:hypothetical protein
VIAEVNLTMEHLFIGELPLRLAIIMAACIGLEAGFFGAVRPKRVKK